MLDLQVREQADGLDVGGTPYTFLRRLGGGVSSEVFEVRGPKGERRALKLLRPHLRESREAQARFLREARALASIDHPNLIPVVDAGTASDGRRYFVMPLLEGETLRDRIRRDVRLEPSAACALLLDVLSGLDAAHRAGIIHRDVKPANVFVTHEAAVVLDFGVAKILNDGPSDVTTGRYILGTPRYLAPEQILGGAIDARTDVYAAGITLFEALSGRDPFGAHGATAQMRAHVYETPRMLRECALVTAELDQIVGRAIERVPAYRWSSAAAFGAALARSRARYLRASDVTRCARRPDNSPV